VDNDPLLSPEIPVHTKRGSTEHEIHCGPSDKYTFRKELPELEVFFLLT
jgi:hypothetical protein